jgi:3,4-dihydroxy 2-butanone 4-phosphate synthase / GTP cyclohydrolase II
VVIAPDSNVEPDRRLGTLAPVAGVWRSGIADSVEHWVAIGPGRSEPFVQAVERLRSKRPVVLLDVSSERARGFVVAAAGSVSALVVNDMLVYARGTPWIVLPEERCAALGLTPLGRSLRPDALQFYTSIEARTDVTTGVSAHDRARTMRVAAAPGATRNVISTPGHVMPIGVRADGMLRHARGVDAALALTMRAGDPGGAAICAILDSDGEPSGGDATRRYAAEHSLPLVSTVEVLDAHLSERELVRPDGEESVATAVGDVSARVYVDLLDRRHFALTWGDVRAVQGPVLTAIHVRDALRDLLDDGSDGPRARIERTLERLAGGSAAILLSLAESPAAWRDGDPRSELLSAKLRLHVAKAILRDLGVERIRTT